MPGNPSRAYTSLKGIDVPLQDLDWNDATAARFRAAMDDDFNTSEACAVLFELAANLNRTRLPATAALLEGLAGTLGLLQRDPSDYLQGTPVGVGVLSVAGIEDRIAARIGAKKAKNFSEADRIRDELRSAGVILEDSATGTTWRRA